MAPKLGTVSIGSKRHPSLQAIRLVRDGNPENSHLNDSPFCNDKRSSNVRESNQSRKNRERNIKTRA